MVVQLPSPIFLFAVITIVTSPINIIIVTINIIIIIIIIINNTINNIIVIIVNIAIITLTAS